MSTNYVGPFEGFYVVAVDGCIVPKITATKNGKENWDIHLDNRYVQPNVTENEVSKWLWFIANAMAISAGYSCHGDNGSKLNPFTTHIIGLSFDKLEELEDEDT